MGGGERLGADDLTARAGHLEWMASWMSEVTQYWSEKSGLEAGIAVAASHNLRQLERYCGPPLL